jgi:hypothetical protein
VHGTVDDAMTGTSGPDAPMAEARAIVVEFMSALGDEPGGAGAEWVAVAQLVEELDRCGDAGRSADLLRALRTFVANRPQAKALFEHKDPEAARLYVFDKVGINHPPSPRGGGGGRGSPPASQAGGHGGGPPGPTGR